MAFLVYVDALMVDPLISLLFTVAYHHPDTSYALQHAESVRSFDPASLKASFQ